jgi:DNA-directed RNA polymerase specialized sigma24 family protein
MSHDPYCHWLSRYFFIDGLDSDDLYQEAAVAVWMAPAGMERLCARRRVIELLRRSKRGGRPEFVELGDVASPDRMVDLVAARERLRAVVNAPLSDLERCAVGRVARGEGCPKGPLDNALQRARKKLAAW